MDDFIAVALDHRLLLSLIDRKDLLVVEDF